MLENLKTEPEIHFHSVFSHSSCSVALEVGSPTFEHVDKVKDPVESSPEAAVMPLDPVKVAQF